ncbi:MAG: NACHT domain-containing protein [Chloroflexota bacterium]
MEETQSVPRPIGLLLSTIVWILSLFWFIGAPDFEPAITLIGATITLGVLLVKKRKTIITDRQILIEKVKAYWVHGVLENSLYQGKQIELGIKYKSELVDRSWMMSLVQLDESAQPFQSSKYILDIFERFAGRMLILGSPGSGKTTTLLSLASDLLKADKDGNQPVPVIFNLATWKSHQQIEDWLANEFESIYQVKKEFATNWLKSAPFRLLLDGLDEVREEKQESCIKAINKFSQDFQHSIVVCSRTLDYQKLDTKLKLAGAILIQPLTHEQLDNHLAAEGEQLAAMRMAINTDALLRELAQSPLMLNALSVTYYNKPLTELRTGTLSERRLRLFENYVQQALKLRPPNRNWQGRSLRWLVIIARTMLHYDRDRFSQSWNPLRRLLSDNDRLLVDTLIFILGLAVSFGYGLYLGTLINLRKGILLEIVWVVIPLLVIFSIFFLEETVDNVSELEDLQLVWGPMGFDILGVGLLLWMGLSITFSLVIGITVGEILIWPIGLVGIISLWATFYGGRYTIFLGKGFLNSDRINHLADICIVWWRECCRIYGYDSAD